MPVHKPGSKTQSGSPSGHSPPMGSSSSVKDLSALVPKGQQEGAPNKSAMHAASARYALCLLNITPPDKKPDAYSAYAICCGKLGIKPAPPEVCEKGAEQMPPSLSTDYSETPHPFFSSVQRSVPGALPHLFSTQPKTKGFSPQEAPLSPRCDYALFSRTQNYVHFKRTLDEKKHVDPRAEEDPLPCVASHRLQFYCKEALFIERMDPEAQVLLNRGEFFGALQCQEEASFQQIKRAVTEVARHSFPIFSLLSFAWFREAYTARIEDYKGYKRCILKGSIAHLSVLSPLQENPREPLRKSTEIPLEPADKEPSVITCGWNQDPTDSDPRERFSHSFLETLNSGWRKTLLDNDWPSQVAAPKENSGEANPFVDFFSQVERAHVEWLPVECENDLAILKVSVDLQFLHGTHLRLVVYLYPRATTSFLTRGSRLLPSTSPPQDIAKKALPELKDLAATPPNRRERREKGSCSPLQVKKEEVPPSHHSTPSPPPTQVEEGYATPHRFGLSISRSPLSPEGAASPSTPAKAGSTTVRSLSALFQSATPKKH